MGTPDRGRRARLGRVAVEVRGLTAAADVTLEFNGSSLSGQAEAVATWSGRLTAAAHATLHAAEPLFPQGTRLVLEDLVVPYRTHDWVVVVVAVVDSSGSSRLVGTAPVRAGYDATVARAVLAAINRRSTGPFGVGDRRARMSGRSSRGDVQPDARQPPAGLPADEAPLVVAVITHQLRAPMATMVQALSTIEERWTELGDEAKTQLVQIGARQARELLRRLDMLVESTAGTTAAPQPTPVVDALDAALIGLDVPSEQVRHRLPAGLAVRAAPGHLSEVLRNLIDNAFTHGAPPITVTAQTDDDTVTLCVADTGPGVASSQQPGLFQPPDELSADVHGIGLYIARIMVELNDGRIWYEPAEPHGARFCVQLPAA